MSITSFISTEIYEKIAKFLDSEIGGQEWSFPTIFRRVLAILNFCGTFVAVVSFWHWSTCVLLIINLVNGKIFKWYFALDSWELNSKKCYGRMFLSGNNVSLAAQSFVRPAAHNIKKYANSMNLWYTTSGQGGSIFLSSLGISYEKRKRLEKR